MYLFRKLSWFMKLEKKRYSIGIITLGGIKLKILTKIKAIIPIL